MIRAWEEWGGGERQARKVEGGRRERWRAAGARKVPGRYCGGRHSWAEPRKGVRVPLHRARVPLAGGGPGPLAAHACSDTASWPAPAISTLPPLALGGMGGDALRS